MNFRLCYGSIFEAFGEFCTTSEASFNWPIRFACAYHTPHLLRDESNFSEISKKCKHFLTAFLPSWPHRLTVRTQGSHPCNWSSILHEVTKKRVSALAGAFFLFAGSMRESTESRNYAGSIVLPIVTQYGIMNLYIELVRGNAYIAFNLVKFFFKMQVLNIIFYAIIK